MTDQEAQTQPEEHDIGKLVADKVAEAMAAATPQPVQPSSRPFKLPNSFSAITLGLMMVIAAVAGAAWQGHDDQKVISTLNDTNARETNHANDLQSQLGSTQAQLAQTQAQLAQVSQQRDGLQQQLTQTQAQLAQVSSQLSASQQQMAVVQQQLPQQTAAAIKASCLQAHPFIGGLICG